MSPEVLEVADTSVISGAPATTVAPVTPLQAGQIPLQAAQTVQVDTLPLYYREIFFARDSMLHPELVVGDTYGMAGDPVPYTVRGDNFFTGMLLTCFILTVVAFAHLRQLVIKQAKDFFYPPHSLESSFSETSGEMRFQLLLLLQTCLLLAIMYYFYTTAYVAETFILDSDYQLIAIFAATFVTYFLLRIFSTTVVNVVFFGGKKNLQYIKTQLFLADIGGVSLYPIVLLQVYFGLSIQNVVYYFIFILVLVKLLAFYKCFVIFFRQNGLFLQIILYFCALEIVPLFSLWGSLALIVNQFKVNY